MPTVLPDIAQALCDDAEALSILAISLENIACVDCRSATTDWDHFRPLVRGKLSTGFGHGVRDLLQAWGPFAQSKGGKDWREWILGKARNSTTSRGVQDLQHRVAAIRAAADGLSLNQWIARRITA